MRTREVAWLIRTHHYFMGAKTVSLLLPFPGIVPTSPGQELTLGWSRLSKLLLCPVRVAGVTLIYSASPGPEISLVKATHDLHCHFNGWEYLCLHVTCLFRMQHIQHSWLFPSSWRTCSSRLWTAQWPVVLLLHWSLRLVSWLNSPFLSDH